MTRRPADPSRADHLWASLPRDSLTIVDRGFFSAKILIPLARGGTNRHGLIRAKRNLRWRVLRRLAPRDALVELQVSRGTPTGVQQELWGICLAYNLVRLEMARVAGEAGVDPTPASAARDRNDPAFR